MKTYEKYGLTEEQYLAMKVKSGNTCYICGASPKKRNLCIDHDHVVANKLIKEKKNISKSCRGLLCFRCNLKLIGRHRDEELFLKAYLYLKEFNHGI